MSGSAAVHELAMEQTKLPQPEPSSSGACTGTLGELFQGPVFRGERQEIAVVSLPFRRRSRCRYTPRPPQRDSDDLGLGDRPKTLHALQLLCAQQGLSWPCGRFEIDSELEPGKGMASSTADIVAAIRCMGALHARRFDAVEIMDVLRLVERSDSVFIDEAVLYLSERQEVVARFGRRLSYTAAFVVEPEVIETEATRDKLCAHYQRHAAEYRRVLDQFVAAASLGDRSATAAAATESALLSQRCFPKRTVPALRSAMTALGADGIFVAHTGSICGYLYLQPPAAAQRSELARFFTKLGQRVQFESVGWHDA
jgi:uncharacterized protein involved in propanediol utilization